MQPQHDQFTKADRAEARQICRGDVAIAAEIRVRGEQKTKVNIIDISQTGFRMECLTFISDCQVVFLTIPSFQQMEARIIWQTEWLYGCQFFRPLYPAIYDHIVRTHPALVVEPTSGPEGMMYGVAASLRWGRPLG